MWLKCQWFLSEVWTEKSVKLEVCNVLSIPILAGFCHGMCFQFWSFTLISNCYTFLQEGTRISQHLEFGSGMIMSMLQVGYLSVNISLHVFVLVVQFPSSSNAWRCHCPMYVVCAWDAYMCQNLRKGTTSGQSKHMGTGQNSRKIANSCNHGLLHHWNIQCIPYLSGQVWNLYNFPASQTRTE